MINWSNGMPMSSHVGDIGRSQITELFEKGYNKSYAEFWIEGVEGEGIFERLSHGSLEQWEFKNGKMNGFYKKGEIGDKCITICTYKDSVIEGEFRQWPYLRGRGEHAFYKDGKRVGEFKVFDEEFNKSKLIKHYYAMDTVSVDVSLAKKDKLPGPWLKDAKYKTRPTMKSLLL